MTIEEEIRRREFRVESFGQAYAVIVIIRGEETRG